ncbi:MAG TPA: MmcQ/YjbR family DNA-binding protein [Isosphaeraceae bacterium]|nr:MmcQ/YjbR family DNA-binding protein [Isosphaeraceae bacterium]
MARKPVTFETVREIAARLPGAVEGISYGTPAFRVGKSLFVRQHQDGESLVVKMDRDERAMRIKADPETFYITDHYLNYPWILVRLSTVRRDDLRELLEDAWRQSAPKALLSSDSGAAAETTRPPQRKRRGDKT